MNILDVSPITNTAQMPVKQGTLQFLQQANKEVFDNMLQRFVGPNYNPNVLYRIWGAQITNVGTTYTITDGALYYEGEVYVVDWQTVTVSTGQTLATVITTTQQTAANADPVIFTDGSSHNIHNIRKITFTSLTGTGLGMPTDFGIANDIVTTGLTWGNPEVLTFGNNQIRVYNGTNAGTITLTLDTVSIPPVSGCKVKLLGIFPYGNNPIAYTPNSQIIVVKQSGNQTITDIIRVITIEYIGAIPGGNIFNANY